MQQKYIIPRAVGSAGLILRILEIFEVQISSAENSTGNVIISYQKSQFLKFAKNRYCQESRNIFSSKTSPKCTKIDANRSQEGTSKFWNLRRSSWRPSENHRKSWWRKWWRHRCWITSFGRIKWSSSWHQRRRSWSWFTYWISTHTSNQYSKSYKGM